MNEILTKLNHSDFILILEDDMQMVREVGPKEIKDLFDYFGANKNSLTLHVNFFKEKETLDYHYMIDETNRYYFIIDEFEPKYVNFTYPGVWNTKLIKESGLVLSENMDFNREFIRKN